jgi:hypothetical protein
MLEKMFGVRLVSKLRAILLMEADFNVMNKKDVRRSNAGHHAAPKENFSKQNHTANDEVWQKCCFRILPARHALQLPSPPWTRLTVTIGLRTPWHLSSSNPLESKA